MRIRIYAAIAEVVLSFALYAQQDLIIRNVDVVDVDQPAPSLLLNRDIIIRNGIIERVQPHSDDAPPAGAGVIDGPFIAMPGFIDTHTHLWQHVAKSVAPSSKLQEWVTKVYAFAPRINTPERSYTLIQCAAAEALLSGITSVIDYSSDNGNYGVFGATEAALRTLEVDGAIVFFTEQSFLTAREKEEELSHPGKKNVELWMGYGPLSFYDVPSVYDGIAMARRLGMRMTEHTMENIAEQRAMQALVTRYINENTPPADEDRKQIGLIKAAPPLPASDRYVRLQRLAQQVIGDADLDESQKRVLQPLAAYATPSPVPLLEYLGGIPDGFVSIHSVWQRPVDLEIYRLHNVTVSYNPESNQYLSSGATPFEWWSQRKLNVSLGTDGAASNDRIDMFSAMRAAINVQKQEIENAERSGAAIDSWRALQMATINGAKALGREASTGSIVAGKEADIVLLSPKRLGLSPLVRANAQRTASLIVYSAGTRDVDTVISNGFVQVRDGKFTGDHDEAWYAATLSALVAQLQQEIDNGAELKQRWAYMLESSHRYLTVNVKDDLDLAIVNDSKANLSIDVRLSGTLFGGTVAAILDDATLRRFPKKNPPRYWSKSYVVAPGGRVTVTKARNTTDWKINGEARSGVTTEQIGVSMRPAP
jgi:cytosine/adenosine deaminase-related metal-dependent hydrolase